MKRSQVAAGIGVVVAAGLLVAGLSSGSFTSSSVERTVTTTTKTGTTTTRTTTTTSVRPSAPARPAPTRAVPVRTESPLPPVEAAKPSGAQVAGTVRTADGRPVPGADVSVRVDLSGSEETYRTFKALASFGLACLDEEGCSEPNAVTRTAADGTFRSRVPNGGSASNKLVVSVTSPVAGGGTVVTAVTYPTSARKGAALGAIVVPSRGITIGGSGRKLSVSEPVLAGARFDKVATTVSTTSRTSEGGYQAGEVLLRDVSKGFDPLVVEDRQVLLQSQASGTIGGRPVVVSAAVLYQGRNTPASRGASCFLTGAKGQLIPQQPCGLTDGDLLGSWRYRDDPACANTCPAGPQKDDRDSYVTFAKPIAARFLVLRGCGFTCEVWVVRADGTQRKLPGPADFADDYLVDLDGTPLKGVHLQTAGGGFLSSLSEVSAFR